MRSPEKRSQARPVVLAGARYPLKRAGTNLFRNASGQRAANVLAIKYILPKLEAGQ
jgi:hypothetical protein